METFKIYTQRDVLELFLDLHMGKTPKHNYTLEENSEGLILSTSNTQFIESMKRMFRVEELELAS
ncbi:hypothetical protein GYB22_11385 [bacterium]|nr:hypothetical protein [bacterium]